MNWNWASWIVVGALIAGVGAIAYSTVGRTVERSVALPLSPEPAPAPVVPPPQPTPPPIDAGVERVELAPECKAPELSAPEFVATGLRFPADLDEQRRFCRTWVELMRRRTTCGNATVATALRQLDTCGRLNHMCEIGKLPSMVDVDLRDILAAGEVFPLAAVYFDKASDQADAAQRRALETFVAREIAGDAGRVLMVFGSASPTSRDEDIDVQWARRRTETTAKVVHDVLGASRMLMVQVRKASVGRGLAVDICNAFDDPALRDQCLALGDDARRQSAFVLSYPSSCFDETHAAEGR